MKTLSFKYLFLIVLLLLSSSINSYAANARWVGESFKSAPCRGGNQGYGPFDYLTRSNYPKELHLVESTHFLPNMENLLSFQNHTGHLVGDLDYTLRAWPNHHRALNSIMRYKLLYPRKRNPLSPVECYFQRGINFSPDDATLRMLYAIFLQKTNHKNSAETQYKIAIELSPKNPVIRYNYGLFLFKQKQYPLAQQQAVLAYDANFPLSGLKNKLKRVKYWPPKKVAEPVEKINPSTSQPKNK
jgi:tetratricopeptide (TPR) repeat protein